MKRMLIVIITAFLCACAIAPARTWVANNKPLAEQGRMQWSEYYSQLYQQYAKSSNTDRAHYMQIAQQMMLVSADYEGGKITGRDFIAARMQAEIETIKLAEAGSDRGVRALGGLAGGASQVAADYNRRQADMYQQRSVEAQRSFSQGAMRKDCAVTKSPSGEPTLVCP